MRRGEAPDPSITPPLPVRMGSRCGFSSFLSRYGIITRVHLRSAGDYFNDKVLLSDTKWFRANEEEEKTAENSQKPVAIVQPTGPSLPPKSKTKAKKKARLNGLIDRLAAKNNPTKESPCPIEEKELELNFSNYNVKTKDGDLGKITILHRYVFKILMKFNLTTVPCS